MLYATGLQPDDLQKPQIGISSMWYEGNPCNMHLNDLAAAVKQGVQEAHLVGFRFNTIGVSDGMSMGTSGMSFSLQSRDLIADSIETVMRAQVRPPSHFVRPARRPEAAQDVARVCSGTTATSRCRGATRTCRARSSRWAASTAPPSWSMAAPSAPA